MMRISVFALVLAAAVAGCGSSTPATNFLCNACNSNADCGGNICFADASGGHFCGAPCGACPSGFDCQALAGSDGKVAQTCFPQSESCAAALGQLDMSVGGGGGG